MDKMSVIEALEKDVDTAVDFEITLAALLSASILVSPSVSSLLEFPTIVVAVILLGLTLLRQMGLISKYSRTDLILDKTSPPLVIASTYAILYISLWLGSYIPSTFPIEPITIGLLATVVLAPVGVAVYEIFYRDFMLLVSIVSYNKYLELDKSKFKNQVLLLVQDWLSRSVLPIEDQPEAVDRIREEETVKLDDVPLGNQIGYRLGVGLAFIAFSVMLLLPSIFVSYFISAPLVSAIKLLVTCLLLGVATNMAIISIRFLYARFGRDDFSMANWRYFRYSVIIYVLFCAEILIEHGYAVPAEVVIMLASVVALGPALVRLWRLKYNSKPVDG